MVVVTVDVNVMVVILVDVLAVKTSVTASALPGVGLLGSLVVAFRLFAVLYFVFCKLHLV